MERASAFTPLSGERAAACGGHISTRSCLLLDTCWLMNNAAGTCVPKRGTAALAGVAQ